ncbi:MAG: LamG-like jellyroll fold domain-containing protein [Luteolibacter sp.]|jgi:hypothetical protein|nr:LamG-like jellyroll fold domain-containing protein [Luteolibacter sp.]
MNFIKLTILALGLVSATSLHAVTYYVRQAPYGNDTRTPAQAQNINTPWLTIQKAADNMGPGDICTIRTGTYREAVIVKASNLTFQAYNTDVVTISGADLIPTANWTADTSTTSIYDWWVTLPAGDVSVNETQVFQGSGATPANQPEARWPNAGSGFPWQNSQLAHPSPYNQLGDWTYVDSASYSSVASFTDAQLPSSFSSFLAGATIHIMSGSGWHMKVPTVTSFNGTTVVTSSTDVVVDGAYTIRPGNEYYITGKKELMNGAGEWFRSGNTLYFFGNSSKPQNVQVKSRKYGMDLSGRSGITLNKLRFFGCTIKTNSSSTNCTFDRLVMNYLYHNKLAHWSVPYAFTLYDNSTLRNSELSFASKSLLHLAGTNIKVINNFLHDSGYVPEGVPMLHVGSGNLVSHNTLRDAGHSLLGYATNGSVIEYNNFYNAMKLCTDGGVCYSANTVGGNSVFRYNLLHDSNGPVGHASSGVIGFYLDNLNSSWVVHHNLIWNINSFAENGTTPTGYGFQVNSPGNFNMIFNNTVWNCSAGSITDHFNGDGPTGNHIYNNIFTRAPQGTQNTWDRSDVRYNYELATDPGFVNINPASYPPPAVPNFQLAAGATNAINKGVVIPGITDVAPSATTTPDLGALESGGTNWATTTGINCVGHNFTNVPSPDPVNSLPTMTFANKVLNSSFESGTLANWTKTGNAGLIHSAEGGAWHDRHLRSGYYSMQFAGGSSEISQVLGGLQPGSRYLFHCGVHKTDTNSTVSLVVRSLPYPDYEIVVSPSGSSTGLWNLNSPSAVTMYELPFVTGPSSTQATIYVRVTRPAGVQVVSATPPTLTTTAPALADLGSMSSDSNSPNYFGYAYPATGVYVDDLSVTIAEGNIDPLPYRMPILSYAFNETTGPTAYDSTTLGSRDATLYGTAAFRAGLAGHGNALAPTASGIGNGYALAPASVAVPATGTGSFSFAFWLKINNNTTYPRILWKNSSGLNGEQGWKVQINGSPTAGTYSMAFFARGAADASMFSHYTAVPAATWTHVAFTMDRENQKVTSYINGIRQGSNALTFGDIDVPNALRLGTDPSDWEMDDFQVWDYSLSPREVAGNANADTSLALRLKFDEAAGSTKAWDVAGRGYNGVLGSTFNPATCWIDKSLNIVNTGTTTFPLVTCNSSGNVDTGSNSFTVACWLKVNSNSGYQFIKKLSSKGWDIMLTPSVGGSCGLVFQAQDAVQQHNIYLSGGIPVGQWVHIAYVINRSDSTIKHYNNGALAGSQAIAFGDISTIQSVMIAAQNTTDLQVNDLRIYTQALTWDRMQQLPYQVNVTPY